ncbi:MAG: archease [Planctomycetes bacterium]|nr:archease [Planctomycetota bacterium]
MYEIFEHTADLGLRVRSADLPNLFAEAAEGLFSMTVDQLTAVRPIVERHVEIKGTDLVYLLFDWLNELLYICDTEHLVFCQFAVELTDAGLTATIRGEPLDEERHHITHEVKAITYHELKVSREGESWLAEVIVDI